MTHIIVVSDSHGNTPFIEYVMGEVQSMDVDLFIHLGDDFDDAQVITQAGYPLIQVPGTWLPAYQNPLIDNRRYEEIEGWNLFLSHTPTTHFNDLVGDADPEAVVAEQKIDLFLHGHTHHPTIKKAGRVTVLNPGHLKQKQDRGYPASYASLKLTPQRYDIAIKKLFGGDSLASFSEERETV